MDIIVNMYWVLLLYYLFLVRLMSGHLNAQYNLRWPEDLKAKVSNSAKEHHRSINADILARLEQSFEIKKLDTSDLTVEELVDELSKRFNGLQVTISNIDE